MTETRKRSKLQPCASRNAHDRFSLVFSAEAAVLMEGHLVDAPSEAAPLNSIGAHWKPWFYTRVRDVLMCGAGTPVTETIPM